MSRVAILQSNYIPWKGYFDLIGSVDHFVLYDTAQYTKRDWRNRNIVKTKDGLKWLTIPVIAQNRDIRIRDVKVADQVWRKKHWSSLQHHYGKSAFFDDFSEALSDLYLNDGSEYLSDINLRFISFINECLGISTKIHRSEDFSLSDGRSEKLLGMCQDLEATVYLSGPAAKGYLDTELFRRSGIDVEWADYGGYPEYHQLHPPFEHGVTILDLLFNEGPHAQRYMKCFR